MITHPSTSLRTLRIQLNALVRTYSAHKHFISYVRKTPYIPPSELGIGLNDCKRSKQALRKQCHKVAAALYLRGTISHDLFIQLIFH